MKKPESHRTQADKVEEVMKSHATQQATVFTEKVRLPGLETLHLKTAQEIGLVLGNLIKSRARIMSITFTAGSSYIEVTSESDMDIR